MRPLHVPPGIRASAARGRRYAWRRRNAFARAWHEEANDGRLVPDPVFIMCPVRSGSTLLRSVLDTHSQICAPHELHLNTMRVSTARQYAADAWAALGLTAEDLENLLWDRALHRLLVASGKRIIVDKTPQNAAIWPRIQAYWPRARYIHLHRHPASIVSSLQAVRPDISTPDHIAQIVKYGGQLESARNALPGPTIRYEDLTTNPEAFKQICRYLGVRWQPRMLRYKTGIFKSGLGDWSANIKSGRIQQPKPLPRPDEVPVQLRALAKAWGYL